MLILYIIYALIALSDHHQHAAGADRVDDDAQQRA